MTKSFFLHVKGLLQAYVLELLNNNKQVVAVLWGIQCGNYITRIQFFDVITTHLYVQRVYNYCNK